MAVAHGRRLLSGYEHVTVTEADIRHPQQVLSAAGVSGLLDFAEPVAVLMAAVLHFVPWQDHVAEIVRQYRQSCAPGSGLALSHRSTDFPQQSDQLQRFQESYSSSDHPVTLRTRPEIAALFAGSELSPPGLVPLPLWGAEDPEGTRTEHSLFTDAGIGFW